jgi:membrane protein DedA with SNARE-associated domain
MESLINYILGWHDGLYILIFLGMLIEGNTTMFIVGFLLNAGNFNPLALMLTAFAGAWAEQFFWFWFGRRLKDSPSRFAAWLIEKSSHFDKHFFHRPKTTLLLSKFIYGAHRAAIARAAVLGIKFKHYVGHMLPVLLFWMLIVGSLGYGVKRSFSLIDSYLQWAEFALLGMVILIFLFQRYVLTGKLKDVWKKL